MFKNFFISTCEQEGDGEGKWEGLETDYHLNGDFLGRFIESENGFQMRKSAFNEIKDYYHALPGISKSQKNQIFYEKLKENLHYFTWIMEEDRIEDNPIKYEIKFIKLLGNERYSINYVMTLFKTFQYDGQHHGELLSHLKTYVQMRLYTLLKPSKRFSNSPIYKAIKALKEKEYKPAKEILALSKEEQKELEKMLDDEIHDNEFGKLLIIRYIYTCWQQQTEDFIHSELDVGKATLEHIIPQKPNKNSNWLQMDSKFRKKYTYRLGNFTLLTMKMNSTAKNYDFSQKQKEYQKTQLFITQELAKLEEITDTDIEERHKKFVEQIIDSF
ncbi:conserved hypothetical protein [Beggiatoa sp. PS]|nr:conserved hypothetical protein [Beggiatoa sp. PS]